MIFFLWFLNYYFQTAFVRQKTPHPRELKAKAHKLFGNKKPLDNQDNVDNNGGLIGGGGHNGDHITSNIDNDEPEVLQQPPQTFFRENENLQETTTNNGGAIVADGQKVAHLDIAVEGELDDEEVKFVFLFLFGFLFVTKNFFWIIFYIHFYLLNNIQIQKSLVRSI